MDNSTNRRKRRPNGHGCVYQKSDGRWVAQFNERDALGYGKSKQVYARTQEEAWRKLAQALPEAKKGLAMLELEPERSLFDERNPHVYAIQCVDGGPIKIGRAHHVERRVSTIQSCCPYPLRILTVIENGGKDIERQIHRMLGSLRLHGEWFRDKPKVHGELERMAELRRVTLEERGSGQWP